MSEAYVDAELYHEWIQSTEWKELVARLKRERGHKCEKCGKIGETQAHHLNYDWYATPYEERTLVLLCRDCHKLAHGIE